jgi:putative peptidoglycan lipid II flippase
MLPGSIGVAAFQINVLLISCFSFWFEPTIVATFSYAVRLMELPQGMFGISLATYLLPTLSGLAAEKKYGEFRQTLSQGLSYLSFANLIAAAIALALAEPIVRLIFERGKFGPEATHRAALALACLAPGLLMFSMVNILARAFYALNDIKTPMKTSIVCLILNLGFALWLVQRYWEAGLGIANTLSATFNVALLAYALRRKLARLGLTALVRTLAVLVPAAVLAGLVAWFLSRLWEAKLGHGTLWLKIGAVFGPGAVAVAVYWVAGLLAKVPEAREIAQLLRNRLSSRVSH